MWTAALWMTMAMQAPSGPASATTTPTTLTPPTTTEVAPATPVSSRMVVTPIAAQRNVDEGLVNVLGDVMLSELQDRGLDVVGYSDIKAMLDNEAAKTALSCDAANCLAELGDAMGARFLIHSNLGRIGAQYVFNMKLIDVEQATVKKRVTRQVSSEDEAALIAVVKSAVSELIESEAPAPPSSSSSGGSSIGLWTLVGGGVVGVGGAAVGIACGVLVPGALDVAPIDPKYPAALERASQLALCSNIGWIASAVGGAGVVTGGVLMVLEE
jgi:hypothetical protein